MEVCLNTNGSNNALRDSILNYAIKLREQTACEFDQTNKTQLNQTLCDLNKVITLNIMAVLKGCDVGTGAVFDAFALAKTSMDVLVSALHMARQRSALETFTLLRVALEAACASHHIYNDQSAYTQYLAGKYKSTRSITHLKRKIPFIGEIWGAFSNACVHANYTFFGPQSLVHEEGDAVRGVVIDCRNRAPKDSQDTILLTFISLVTMILLKVIEDIITEDSSIKSPWRSIVGTDTLYSHATDIALMKYYNELRTNGLFAEEERDEATS